MCFRFGGKHKKEGTRKSKNQKTRFKAQEGKAARCQVKFILLYPSRKSAKSPQIMVQTLSLRHGTGVTTD
jgi:hypothetical protein